MDFTFGVSISTYILHSRSPVTIPKALTRTVLSSIDPKVTDKVMNKHPGFSFMTLKQNFPTTSVDFFLTS